MTRSLAIAVFLLMALMTRAGAAQIDPEADRASARQLFYDASEAMRAGDGEKAAELFARSNELFPSPTAALGEARALVHLGRFVLAQERYQSIVNTPLAEDASDAFEQAVADAQSELKVLRPRIPFIVLRWPDAIDARITIDETAIPAQVNGVKRPIDPGTHRVSATARGHRPFSEDVTLADGEVVEIDIELEALPSADISPPPPTPDRPPPVAPEPPSSSVQATVGWVAVGIGGAGLLAWAITGAMYLDAESTVTDGCNPSKQCTDDALAAVDRGRTLGIVNTVALFAGVALAGIGVTLVLTAPDDEAPKTTLNLSPGSITLTGEF